MPTWYEQQIEQAYLGGKRPPQGDSPMALMAGVPYRTPLNDMGHIIGFGETRDEDPLFLCGRSVYLEEWFATSGAAARWGPNWYVLPDTRKGNKCSICATAWKNGAARRELDRKRSAMKTVESPIPSKEWREAMGAEWAMSDKQLSMRAAWVAILLGGEVIEE